MLSNLLNGNLSGLNAVPTTNVGGMQIAVIDREQSAALMVEEAIGRRGDAKPPMVSSSANGQVLSFYAANPDQRILFDQVDLMHADGMPMVWASRIGPGPSLPERVATTDLFHDVAEKAAARGATFYMLGASQGHLSKAMANVRRRYPTLKIVGARNGYFRRDELPDVLDEINRCQPDILWVAMGIPREQEFCLAHRADLPNVGVIKTSGGLFDHTAAKDFS